MSLLLTNRDYAADGNGGVAAVRDGEELVGEVLFRLTARRGSFPFLPGLGSRMHQLRREKPSAWESLASSTPRRRWTGWRASPSPGPRCAGRAKGWR